MSFIYDYYGQFTSLGGLDVPVMVVKFTTRMHFRGRQNEFFTPTSYASRMLNTATSGAAPETQVEAKQDCLSSLTASEKTRVDHVVVSRDQSISAVKQLLARLQRDDGGSSG